MSLRGFTTDYLIKVEDMCLSCQRTSEMNMYEPRDASLPIPDPATACRRCGVRPRASSTEGSTA